MFFHFLDGEILLINKPLKWTSFDVVGKIRVMLKYRLGIKKIKVGHSAPRSTCHRFDDHMHRKKRIE